MPSLYTNENFPKRAVGELRLPGHNVLTSFGAGRANQKIPDEQVLAFVHELGRAVITLNRLDLIRLHRDTGGSHSGIIVCTRDDADPAAFARRIHTAMTDAGVLAGQLVRVVRP